MWTAGPLVRGYTWVERDRAGPNSQCLQMSAQCTVNSVYVHWPKPNRFCLRKHDYRDSAEYMCALGMMTFIESSVLCRSLMGNLAKMCVLAGEGYLLTDIEMSGVKRMASQRKI